MIGEWMSCVMHMDEEVGVAENGGCATVTGG